MTFIKYVRRKKHPFQSAICPGTSVKSCTVDLVRLTRFLALFLSSVLAVELMAAHRCRPSRLGGLYLSFDDDAERYVFKLQFVHTLFAQIRED